MIVFVSNINTSNPKKGRYFADDISQTFFH